METAATSLAHSPCAVGTKKAMVSPRSIRSNTDAATSQASTSSTYSIINTDSRRSESSLTRSQQNTSTVTRSSYAQVSISSCSQPASMASIGSSKDSTAQLNDRLSSLSKMEKKPIEDEEEQLDVQLHTWSICPIANSYAVIAVLAVLFYSLVFLFYAPRYKLVLFIMTGLIAIGMVVLYIFGVLSLLYMMHRISQMEKDEDMPKNAEEKCWPIANSSSSSDSNDTIISNSNHSDSLQSNMQVNKVNGINQVSSLPLRPQSKSCGRAQQVDRLQALVNHQPSAKYSTCMSICPSSAISLHHSPIPNGNDLRMTNGAVKPSCGSTSILEMKF